MKTNTLDAALAVNAAPMLLPSAPHIFITPLGLSFQGEPDFEEWCAIGPQISRAMRSMEFVIGDWLVYGEAAYASRKRQGRVDPARYDLAVRSLGIDYAILRNYAYVSRRVPLSLRNDRTSWSHHRAVAKLPPEQQTEWLQRATDPSDPLSFRRLRVSINSGRVVSVAELTTPPADQSIITHIPPINRLCLWWRESGGRDWLRTRSRDQLRNMLTDFQPLIDILKALQSEAQLRP